MKDKKRQVENFINDFEDEEGIIFHVSEIYAGIRNQYISTFKDPEERQKDVKKELNLDSLDKLHKEESDNLKKPFTEGKMLCAINHLKLTPSNAVYGLNAKWAVKTRIY